MTNRQMERAHKERMETGVRRETDGDSGNIWEPEKPQMLLVSLIDELDWRSSEERARVCVLVLAI